MTSEDVWSARAAILNAMANPKRLEVLALLNQTEFAVSALAERVSMSQSALSQHLSRLRAEKLVKTRHEAQSIYYSSDSVVVRRILNILEKECK
ncbi:winged helix-turn-helix transcriptional regulator [Agrobacterium rhizogenes]|nr:winged helix-turn-helix transcriptional regulator [Rhizobium rhizogenes]NTJ80005.1 winged helix-turn-helix transcriptional regulator [Rhizobium rhizogenes]